MTESQTTEWKENWRDDHLAQVCGFANAQGGTLVVGRNDKGVAVGLRDAKKLLEDLPNKIRDLLGVVAQVDLLHEEDKDLLAITTPAYPNPISYRGHYYLRSGSTLQELKGAALDQLLLRRYGRTWDGSPWPGVGIDDLSPAAFKQFRQLAQNKGRLDAVALAESDAGLLEKLKLTEGAYLKRAAVLLFHPDPARYFTGAFVKIGYFDAAEIRYHDLIEGDLFTQARQTLDVLLLKYLRAAIHYEDNGLVRVERYPTPREALREAVLNALIHRDYANTAPIQIRVYDDKLMLWNPATLPPGWTRETLLAPHNSQPHNPDVANAFFRAGEIETWGRGIARIFDACRSEGTPEPLLKVDVTGFWLEFPFDPAYLRAMRQTEQVTAQVTAQVTPEVGRLLAVLDGEMGRADLQAVLSLRHLVHFRDGYLRPALAAGLIEMTIPDKPNSRLQKYRLTDRGRQALQLLAKEQPS